MLSRSADDQTVFHTSNVNAAPKNRRKGESRCARARKAGERSAAVRKPLQSSEQSAQEQEHNGAHRSDADRAEVQDTSANRSPAQEAGAEPTSNESADDAEEDGNDATGRVPPWHQKLCQRAGDEAEQYPVEPERQTLVLLLSERCLGHAGGRASPGCHPINPEENERADNCQDDTPEG